MHAQLAHMADREPLADGIQPTKQAPHQGQLQSLAMEYSKVCEVLARKEYEERVSQLSLCELAMLPDPDGTKVYKTLGRAFLLSSMDQVRERLGSVSRMAATEAQRLKERKQQLETTLKSL